MRLQEEEFKKPTEAGSIDTFLVIATTAPTHL